MDKRQFVEYAQIITENFFGKENLERFYDETKNKTVEELTKKLFHEVVKVQLELLKDCIKQFEVIK